MLDHTKSEHESNSRCTNSKETKHNQHHQTHTHIAKWMENGGEWWRSTVTQETC